MTFTQQAASIAGRVTFTCDACGDTSAQLLPGQKGAGSAWRTAHERACPAAAAGQATAEATEAARERAGALLAHGGYSPRGLGLVSVRCPDCIAVLTARPAPAAAGGPDSLQRARAALVPVLAAHLTAAHPDTEGASS